MDPLVWSIILLSATLLVFCIELFVPSAGILGFVALALLVSAIVMAFMHSSVAGGIVLALVCLSLPLLFVLAVKIWPHTPIGKRILIGRFQEEEVLPAGDHYEEINALIGRVGRAKTKMLPSGSVVIDEKTYDALSDGFAIQEGDLVKVVAIKTNRPLVQPIESEQVDPSSPDDMLAAPIDELGLDGIDD